jgi:hypothetical protein
LRCLPGRIRRFAAEWFKAGEQDHCTSLTLGERPYISEHMF